MDKFIADVHFGHFGVIEFDDRPFSSVEEMDDAMIKLWNENVYYDDNVWIVGDFCYHSAEPPEWYLSKLRGVKHLIVGNHDISLLKNKKALGYFEDVKQSIVLNLNGQMVYICHFPMAEWNGMYHGWWHMYGHLHNSNNEAQQFMLRKERALNISACVLRYKPSDFNSVIQRNKEWRGSLVGVHDVAEIK